jgi:HSP20 family protein
MFSRQVILGDTLDTENIRANYHSGVLRLNIPVAERAKPRKISIDVQSEEHQQAIDAKSEDRQAVSA